MKKENRLSKVLLLPLIKILLGLIFCILIPMIINKLILENLFQLFGLSENINRGIRVFISAIMLMPIFYIYLYRKLDGREITEFSKVNIFKNLNYGFYSAVIIILFSFILLIIFDLVDISGASFPQNLIVNLIIILGLVITKELVFRGIFYRIIEKRYGTIFALILSAIIFAILHLSNENTSVFSFISVMVGGISLGLLFTYTKSLWMPIAFHFGWNLMQVLLGFGLSGGNEFYQSYIFQLNLDENNIISGGNSGIENSLISIIFLSIFALYILYLCNKNQYFQKRSKN